MGKTLSGDSSSNYGHKVVRIGIADFDDVGPVRMRIVNIPLSGDPVEEVYDGWMDSDRMTISLPAGVDFPLKARGWRYPQSIARIVSKETRKIIEPAEPKTWTSEQKKCGAEHKSSLDPKTRKYVPVCSHEPKCPRAIDLTDGMLDDENSVWMLREDGVPCREEDLEATRASEEATRAAPKPQPVAAAPQAARVVRKQRTVPPRPPLPAIPPMRAPGED
jgi:hypothetical protein